MIEETLRQRGSTHGDFRQNGQIIQGMKDIARTGNWSKLTDHQREAIDMILHKVGRILSGNPHEPDHWRDIAGYATLITQILGGTYEEAKSLFDPNTGRSNQAPS